MDNDRREIEPEQLFAESPSAEDPDTESRSRSGGFAAGVLLGLLTGVGLATLFSPLSGQEMRQRTAEKAPELWRRREELAREAAQAARSRWQEAKEAGQDAAREADEGSRQRFERFTGRKPG